MYLGYRWGFLSCTQEDKPLNPFGYGKINKRLGVSQLIGDRWHDEKNSVDTGICVERVFECLIVKPIELDRFVWVGCSGTTATSDEDRLICFLEQTRKDEACFACATSNEDCHLRETSGE